MIHLIVLNYQDSMEVDVSFILTHVAHLSSISVSIHKFAHPRLTAAPMVHKIHMRQPSLSQLTMLQLQFQPGFQGLKYTNVLLAFVHIIYIMEPHV